MFEMSKNVLIYVKFMILNLKIKCTSYFFYKGCLISSLLEFLINHDNYLLYKRLKTRIFTRKYSLKITIE